MGPTLEFYSLVSTELQRDELGLWNESDSYKRSSNNISDFIKAKSTKRFYHKSSTITNNTSDGSDRLSLSIIENVSLDSSNNTSSNVVQYIHDELNVDLTVNSQEIIETSMQYSHREMHSQSPTVDTLPNNVTYVNPVYGLFPSPIGKASKFGYISKIKSKFRFLGKFMAKAVMDSRMVRIKIHS